MLRQCCHITIPDHVTSIERGTFFGCKRLTNVVLPEGVTNIGNQAFHWCSSLTNITIPSKRLPEILPKSKKLVVHMENIANISTRYRPGAAVGFAEDGRDCADKNGKKYCKYIRSNAAKLIGLAIEHPALFQLMLREKLIDTKDMDAVSEAVQGAGSAELIAALRDYRPSC